MAVNIQVESHSKFCIKSFLVRFYCWMVVAFFGAVLLDAVYAGAMRRVLDSGPAATVSSEVSDFLLLMIAATVPVAILALSSCGQSKSARHLFAASLALLMGELLLPIVFGSLLVEAYAGTWIRIFLSGSASILALMGLNRFYLRG